MTSSRQLRVKAGSEAEVLQAAIATVLARKVARESMVVPVETDVVKWAEANFRISETGEPIRLMAHQAAILRYIFTRDDSGHLRFNTVLYSTPKKSGKTTLAAVVIQWVAETWGRFGEILCVGNDAAQARERGFAKVMESIQLAPGFDAGRRVLQGVWRLLTSEATCLRTGTTIRAVATDYAGEAGANPTLTVWCTPLATPVLRADLSWVPAGGLEPGERLVAFEEYPSAPNVSRRFLTGTVLVNEQRVLPCMEIQFIDGSTPLRASPEHMWLVRRRGQHAVSWKRTDEIRDEDELGQIFPVWEPRDDWDAGYVAGALDGEGHLSVNRRPRMKAAYNMGVSQMPGKFLLEKLAEIWERDSIRFTWCRERNQPTERLRIDRKESLVRALGMYRPMRLLSQFSPDNLGHLRAYTWRRVRVVERREPELMACIATDVKTYLANGYAAHNTELWGFIHKADLRFWAELGPSPTRPDSMRWVETYAGYDGESELLFGLYEKAVKSGRQLTAGEIGDLSAFVEAPNPDSPVPCWVDDAAGIFAYWDSGPGSRRMPWQQGEHGERYYANEAATQTESQFDRLHWNQWVGAESSFVPIEWWDACLDPLPLVPGDTTPIVLAADAAVTGDCFGLVAMSRDSKNPQNVALRGAQKWDPPPGGAIDYAGPEAAIRWYCVNFNVVQLAYDPYQLHDMATRLTREGVAWCRPFSQGEERLIADKLLYDLIAHRRIRHDGNAEVREHISNANAKQAANEDTRLRLVKKSANRKVDLAVCLSMGASECLRLMIE